MDAVTPQAQKSADQHSHVVRPAEMEWQKTRFPGCEVKTLLFDPATGLVTALMRFEPGAVLPDHEHVQDRADLRARGQARRQGGRRPQGSRSSPANSSGARRAAAMSPGRPRAG